MSVEFVIRLVGMIIFAIIGVYWGSELGKTANINPGQSPLTVEQYAFTMGLVGALVG